MVLHLTGPQAKTLPEGGMGGIFQERANWWGLVLATFWLLFPALFNMVFGI
jgi:hypothetical protein